jgi:hypothetical protein
MAQIERDYAEGVIRRLRRLRRLYILWRFVPAVHKPPDVRAAIEAVGALVRLPPYSSDSNPIERMRHRTDVIGMAPTRGGMPSPTFRNLRNLRNLRIALLRNHRSRQRNHRFAKVSENPIRFWLGSRPSGALATPWTVARATLMWRLASRLIQGKPKLVNR